MKKINAAMEIFSKNEYKKASTESIANKADISKGLLFYYFRNKKELYVYVVEYTINLIKEKIFDEKFCDITDFFELIRYIGEKKVNLMKEMPFLMDFSMRFFSEANEEIKESMGKLIEEKTQFFMDTCFENIDLYKFKKDVNYKDVINMLVYMAEGYLIQRGRMNLPIEIEPFMLEYEKWLSMFRKIAYREEYI